MAIESKSKDSISNADEERVRRIEDLVHRLEQIENPESRSIAEQLMQAVLDLHGAGLERMMELAFESATGGEVLIRRFAGDGLISSLLVLHDLHPDDLETRVRQVLTKMPGHVELAGVLDGVVRVRYSVNGCGTGNFDEEALKAMLREAVPDIGEVTVHRVTELKAFVPLLSINGSGLRVG
jgi:hypothetical protein